MLVGAAAVVVVSEGRVVVVLARMVLEVIGAPVEVVVESEASLGLHAATTSTAATSGLLMRTS